MEGSKLVSALLISMMVVMVFASFATAQEAPAPAPDSGAAALYVPAVLTVMASLFAWMY